MVDFTPGAKDRHWPAVSAIKLRFLQGILIENLNAYIKSRNDKGYTSNELNQALVLLEQHCKSDSDAAAFLNAVCDEVIPKEQENDGWFHGTSGHLSSRHIVEDVLRLSDSNIQASTPELYLSVLAEDFEAREKHRLQLFEQKQALEVQKQELTTQVQAVTVELKEVKQQNTEQAEQIRLSAQQLAEAKIVIARLEEEKKSSDESRTNKKRKKTDLDARARTLDAREAGLNKKSEEYDSKEAVRKKQQEKLEEERKKLEEEKKEVRDREVKVAQLEEMVIKTQAHVLSISQRLSQSQPPSPSPSPRPATILHVKTEMERIRENLSPLRFEVMQRLITLIRGNNTAAYACLRDLLLDIANKTDRGTAEIVRSWHDQGVVTALATLPSSLSDTNGYTMPSPSANYPRDKTLHSFVILLENGVLLGIKDLTLSAQIAKYSREYRAEYKIAENGSASASISASSSAFSFVSPSPVSRAPSMRGGFGVDHKR